MNKKTISNKNLPNSNKIEQVYYKSNNNDLSLVNKKNESITTKLCNITNKIILKKNNIKHVNKKSTSNIIFSKKKINYTISNKFNFINKHIYLNSIFLYLDLKDLYNCNLVNKKFYSVINNETTSNNIWRNIITKLIRSCLRLSKDKILINCLNFSEEYNTKFYIKDILRNQIIKNITNNINNTIKHFNKIINNRLLIFQDNPYDIFNFTYNKFKLIPSKTNNCYSIKLPSCNLENIFKFYYNVDINFNSNKTISLNKDNLYSIVLNDINTPSINFLIKVDSNLKLTNTNNILVKMSNLDLRIKDLSIIDIKIKDTINIKNKKTYIKIESNSKVYNFYSILDKNCLIITFKDYNIDLEYIHLILVSIPKCMFLKILNNNLFNNNKLDFLCKQYDDNKLSTLKKQSSLFDYKIVVIIKDFNNKQYYNIYLNKVDFAEYNSIDNKFKYIYKYKEYAVCKDKLSFNIKHNGIVESISDIVLLDFMLINNQGQHISCEMNNLIKIQSEFKSVEDYNNIFNQIGNNLEYNNYKAYFCYKKLKNNIEVNFVLKELNLSENSNIRNNKYYEIILDNLIIRF